MNISFMKIINKIFKPGICYVNIINESYTEIKTYNHHNSFFKFTTGDTGKKSR